jgi:hypothetical protein
MSHAVPHSAVVGFVRAVLRAVVPRGLLGSSDVEVLLFKRIRQFVSQQRGDVLKPEDVGCRNLFLACSRMTPCERCG